MDMIRRAECDWCGLSLDTECPNPTTHAILHAQSETTWREVARRPMPKREVASGR